MTSPAWALLKRELTAALRGRSAFALVAGLLVVCIAIVVSMWPDRSVSLIVSGQRARSMFHMFVFAHLTVATLLPPGLAALAFAEDRRHDTLDQLRLSLLTTGGLVGAKLLSAVAVIALLFVASLPCLGVQLMLVGVSLDEVLEAVATILSTATMGAGIGILCAMRFRNPATGLIMSYAVTAFALGGWMLLAFLGGCVYGVLFFRGDVDAGIHYLLVNQGLEPAFLRAARAAFGSYVYALSAGRVAYIMWDGFYYRMIVAGLVVLLATVRGCRPLPPTAQVARKFVDDPEALRVRRRRFPFYLFDPLHRKPPLPDGFNPVLVREWRSSVSYRPRVVVPAFLLTASIFSTMNIGIAWVIPHDRWAYEDALRAFLLMQIFVILLYVQVVSAGAFAGERERERMDFLRTSLLSSTSIFWGQFVGGSAAALPFLAGAATAFLVSIAAVFFGLGNAPMLLGGYATLLACAWLTLCIGYFVTLFVKNTAAAIAAGIAANLGVYLWPFLGIAWCESVLHGDLREDLEWIFQCLSPLIAFAAHRWRIGGAMAGQQHNLSLEGGLYVVLAVFAALGFLLLVQAKLLVERSGMRR